MENTRTYNNGAGTLVILSGEYAYRVSCDDDTCRDYYRALVDDGIGRDDLIGPAWYVSQHKVCPCCGGVGEEVGGMGGIFAQTEDDAVDEYIACDPKHNQ